MLVCVFPPSSLGRVGISSQVLYHEQRGSGLWLSVAWGAWVLAEVARMTNEAAPGGALCSNCGLSGHSKNNCPRPKVRQPSPAPPLF
jgi:hypothetical protein